MLMSCILAFALNYTIFLNTSLNSPLTQTMCGNLKVTRQQRARHVASWGWMEQGTWHGLQSARLRRLDFVFCAGMTVCCVLAWFCVVC